MNILEHVFDPEIFYIKKLNGAKFLKSYISASTIAEIFKKIKDENKVFSEQIAILHLIQKCSYPESKGESGGYFEKIFLQGLQKCSKFLIKTSLYNTSLTHPKAALIHLVL